MESDDENLPIGLSISQNQRSDTGLPSSSNNQRIDTEWNAFQLSIARLIMGLRLIPEERVSRTPPPPINLVHASHM